MLSEITYAGNKSSDHGLVIERFPLLNRPSRKYEKVSVPGRNGDIYFKQDAWNNYTQEYEVWSGSRNAAAPDLWTNIFKWLYPEERGTTVEDILNLEVNGYHQLIDTYEPNTIRLAQFNEETEVENSWNNFGKSIIRFDCRPERFTADAFDWINLENETPVAESTEPYLLKASPEADIEVDEIVGGSVGWNQLVTTYNATMEGATITASDGLVTINGTTTGTLYYRITTTQTVANHKYFILKQQNQTINGVVLYNVNLGIRVEYNVDSTVQMATGTAELYIRADSGITFSGYTCRPQAVDLTLALGSTIADYVYSLETATAGAGVTWLKTYFPRMFGQYNAYDAGSIKSVEGVSAHKMTDGDETWSYPLDSSLELRGIPKLDSSNNLYYDGDTYASNGTVTRKYGIVDLGTLTWTYQSSTSMFYSGAYNAMKSNTTNGIVSNGYILVSSTLTVQSTDKSIAKDSNGRMYIKDSSYTTSASFQTAMSGVYLVYELATPTTESATPYQNPQRVGSTEEYVTDSIVPVGHNSKYYDNPFVNPTVRTAKPCLKVYGSGAGTVYCNGTTITISDIPQYIYIDSDSQNCFKEISDANLNSLVSLSNGFPVLSAGDNSISWSGGVTNVEVMPRWWNL